MLVTCLYDIYNNSQKMEEYIKLFKPLAESDLNIYVYTSPELAHYFTGLPNNIKLFVVPLDLFEMYKIGINSKCELPIVRNPEKDTREYLSLQNTKVEFLLRASELSEDKTIIWIDFAILKLFKNSDECLELLRKINNMNFDKINIPGCWYKGEGHYINTIHWRFCGSFAVFPCQFLKRFYDDCYKFHYDFCNLPQYKLTWEVNTWSYVEHCTKKEYIKWYYALHDDSMVRNLLENIDPWTGQKI